MLQQIDFVPGDIVRVHQKIKEGEKTRVQVFQGVVLQIRGRGENKSFTVKKDVQGISVEKIWQVDSPNIEKVEVKEKSKKRIRRAKLNYALFAEALRKPINNGCG
jgi:large subunit ribosomal protein L19